MLRAKLGGVVERSDVREDDGELVAANASDCNVLLHAVAQALRHQFEQFVAELVSERVVDGLEVVEVEIEHRDAIANFVTLLLSVCVSRSWNSTRFGKSVKES